MRILELGHVVLYVTDLAALADFYRNTLSFHEIMRTTNAAAFSSGRTHHELLLIAVGGRPRYKSHAEPGLYHIGFKIGDSHAALKKVYEELQKKNVPIVGTADHGVTHSIYIKDPDGNELELYADVSDAWKKDPKLVMTPTRSLAL